MLSVEATLEAVEQAHRDKPFYEHPLWAGLLKASFDKEQVKEFVRQFGDHSPSQPQLPRPPVRELSQP